MWRLLDWIDDFTGHDRRTVRFFLALTAFFVVLFASEWAYHRVFPESSPFCDAHPTARICTGEPIPTVPTDQIAKDSLP